MDTDGLGSCASNSNSLILLSYSMAVFSTKSFELFFLDNIEIIGLNIYLLFSILANEL